MTGVNYAQPDVTLILDLDGVIRKAALSNAIATEAIEGWLGRPWSETVGDAGNDNVRQMVEDARATGVSAFHQVTQRFPSGLELAVEYTTVRLGGKAGLIAIGRNLQAVTELRTRLIAAQQSMEQDYWKLREVETRYRLLFDASNEPVLLIGADDLRVVEANPAAIRGLGLARGRELPPEIPAIEREAFHAMLLRVREQGKAPGIILHLGPDAQPWLVRASLMTGDPGAVFLLQLATVGIGPAAARRDRPPVETLVDRLPDGFVVIDQDGTILKANRTFLDLVQMPIEGSVVGERLGRWLTRPGADMAVLLANVQRHGAVRLFATTLAGELGSDAEVEISAAGNTDTRPQFIGLIVRGVGRRLPAEGDDGDRLDAVLGAIAEQIGKSSLRTLVQDAVARVERSCIRAALSLAEGNRTAAAEILGLSRQSLYSKLSRYAIGGEPESAPARDG